MKSFILVTFFVLIVIAHALPSKYSYKVKVVIDRQIEILDGEDVGDVFFSSHDALKAMHKTIEHSKPDSIIYSTILVIE